MISPKELAQKIYDQITEHPENHDQNTWESYYGPECGTTRCVAGWAIALAADSAPTTPQESFQTRRTMADELGAQPHWEYLGAALLGLDPAQAAELFFSDDEEAPRLLAEWFELDTGE